jgi:hypothetical protein
MNTDKLPPLTQDLVKVLEELYPNTFPEMKDIMDTNKLVEYKAKLDLIAFIKSRIQE